MEPTKVAMIGAGNVGKGLGLRLLGAGHPVRFGLREGKEAPEWLAAQEGDVDALPLAEAAQWAQVIVLAVPGKAITDAVKSLGDLEGKIVIDATNPVGWDAGPVWAPPKEGSNAAAVAAQAPGAKVLKAFNTFGAEFHADPSVHDGGISVFLAGDDDDAKTRVSNLAQSAGFESIDAGPLRNAAVVENVAILWIHLATVGKQGRDFAIQMLQRQP